MKIGLTGYPLTLLAEGGRMKKTNADMKKDLLGRFDTSMLSDVPHKAVVEYLKAMDEVLSDIIRMVDGGPVLSGGKDVRAVSQAATRQPSAARADAVIYLPGASPGGGGPETEGEFIIIKDVPAGGMTDMPAECGRSAPEVLSEQAAAGLSGTDVGIGMKAGIGMKTDGPFKTMARDKFIISVDLKNGTPVPSIIRHDRFGGTDVFSEASGNIEDEGTASMASRVAVLLAGSAGRALSGDGGVFTAAGTSGLAEGLFGSDEFPGVTIRVVPSSMLTAPVVKNTRMENEREAVVERLASLVQVVEGGIIGCGEEPAGAADDDRSGADAIEASVGQAIIGSALIAGRGPANRTGTPGEVPAGVLIDEKGRLRIDREALAGALYEKKDETMRFVRDFSSSLHERITYFFHPFTGLCAAGAGAAPGVGGACGKEGVADEEEDIRADLEKKLDEIRMLLESSYQLKEVFMGMSSSGSAFEDDG